MYFHFEKLKWWIWGLNGYLSVQFLECVLHWFGRWVGLKHETSLEGKFFGNFLTLPYISHGNWKQYYCSGLGDWYETREVVKRLTFLKHFEIGPDSFIG